MICLYSYSIQNKSKTSTIWTYRIYRENKYLINKEIKLKKEKLSFHDAAILPLCAAFNWMKYNCFSIFGSYKRDIRVFLGADKTFIEHMITNIYDSDTLKKLKTYVDSITTPDTEIAFIRLPPVIYYDFRSTSVSIQSELEVECSNYLNIF